MRPWLLAAMMASCLLVSAPIAAQSIAGGGKVGLVIGDLQRESPLLDATPKGGFAVGGFVSVPVSGRLSIEPQLLLLQKGATANGETLKLHYLEAPVLAMIRLPMRGEAVPFVYGGPAFAFALSAKAAVVGRPDDEDITSDIRRTDVTVTFGGGFNVDRMTLEARYTRGLVNIARSGPALETRAFLLLAGFSFP
jgi:hypothetical protein